jgi:uncharacterized tellurite resistance protein B-like protein
MDENTRRKICRLVAGIAVVDDDLDPAEEAFIENMLRRFGLPVGAREELFPIMDSHEAAQELAALPESVQQTAFAMLLDAAASDKRYAEEEMEFLRHVAEVVGVSHEELARRMADLICS